MANTEYEIESITQARVAKKRKKIIWQYHVKWKGYSIDENTWEPATSFSANSTEIIANFWQRVDTGGRDPQDLTQFQVGQTFFPSRKPTATRKSTSNAETPKAGPSNESTSTRASKRRRSSPPAAEPHEKPTKRARGREPPPTTRSADKRATTARIPAKSTPTPRPPRKPRSPSTDVVPESEDGEEEQEEVMHVDPQPQSVAEPTPAVPVTAEQPAPKNKERSFNVKKNPRVKIADDFEKMDDGISTKARIVGQDATAVASSSSSPRKSPRKPGPGRSSSGFLNNKEATSSLLTFDKGELKTVKGKSAMPVLRAEASSGPATSGQLLQLGGLDPAAAEGLDDFEEEEIPAQAETPTAIQQSFAAAKNNLFPPGASVTPSFSKGWHRSTIFGPLGLGSDATRESPSAEASSKPLLLKLDTTVSIPLALSDVSQSLDTLVCDKPPVAPGKFFANANAHKLLDTVRAGGASAKASLSASASEEDKAHFARFRARLDRGDLFTVMVGTTFIAFSSSVNPLMQRLNLPSALTAMADSVFVSQLEIENHSAYVDIVETADTSRW
ncbi:hypothetical protein FB45DRAFT_1003044 [Roridomyces roridus]|uniref:Chromo domain-containing protein n=1 Tax=Roridomyces roridus TaxID=1738132 RepID=A0AAD7BWS7_9AGAR|nr:hypothetical protein FB45DRAFT_1003044 [Roridomyces roridus]